MGCRYIEKIKEVLSGYGVWIECQNEGSYHIIAEDFNSKTWCDETYLKVSYL
ncbi:hypothetical protein M3215_16895 [Bacillus cytotoxicus]|uniref:Uncharacterized protein n=1 Tax=Bacillus cytotoxicus TaxID=580165 RepID=A0ACC6AA19_9BACI|nr:hypothetical protein [Bacillus cytotoxicus]